MKPILFGILVFQVGLTIWYEVLKFDLMGVFIQAVQIGAGYYAWLQDMNITILLIYGVICLVNGVILTVQAILPIVKDLVTLDIISTVVSCILPFGNLAGALLAYIVYKDWKRQQEENERTYAQQLLAAAHQKEDPGLFGGLFGGAFGGATGGGAARPLFDGKGFTLGSTDAAN